MTPKLLVYIIFLLMDSPAVQGVLEPQVHVVGERPPVEVVVVQLVCAGHDGVQVHRVLHLFEHVPRVVARTVDEVEDGEDPHVLPAAHR